MSLLLFADDIVLLTDTRDNLQHMLCTVDQFSRMYRFEFNGKKSNVLVFSGRKKVKVQNQ